MRRSTVGWFLFAAGLAGATLPVRARAQDTSGVGVAGGGVGAQWARRASAAQADQPRWITPLVTTTPRLEQEFRYDGVWRTVPAGTETTVIGNGKGLELIPVAPVELIVGVPSYTVHRTPRSPDGWGDWPLLLKYRFLAGNETHGNDILTGFLGLTVPTGGKANGSRHAILTPALAGGKGWGAVDVQTTVGVNIPSGNTAGLGHPILYNIAAQYHVARFLWPQVEANGTSWRDGTNRGRTQLFITPGVVFGRFPIRDRLGVTVGGGVQIAATTYHQYDHALIVSARMPF